jgi:hypothetical protein
MPHRDDPSGAFVETGNVPGNPNRSYRMSMLAHGFVDDGDRPEFTQEDTDRMTYGVVRLPAARRTGRRSPFALGLVIAVVFVVLVVALSLVT